MDWKDKRKKKHPFFADDDFFSSDFDEISEMMNEMVKRAFQGSFSNFPKSDKPVVYGYSVKVGPDGKPKVQEFGNVGQKGKKIRKEREPLVDVIDKEKIVTAIAELPGVDKKDITLEVQENGNKLRIKVPNKYYKVLDLPARVKEEAKGRYKNGVLEVDLKKIKPSKPDNGKKIKIE